MGYSKDFSVFLNVLVTILHRQLALTFNFKKTRTRARAYAHVHTHAHTHTHTHTLLRAHQYYRQANASLIQVRTR
jgi:hypothetical protein